MFERYCQFCVRMTRVHRWLRWPLAVGLLLFYAGEVILERARGIVQWFRERPSAERQPMRWTFRRAVSSALVLAMVAGMLPTMALATEGETSEETVLPEEQVQSEASVVIGNHGYPYGKDMYENPTLIVDATLSGEGELTYQWQKRATENDDYSNISGATTAQWSPDYWEMYELKDQWVRCLVNGTVATEPVQIISYGSVYYLSNGTMAYSWIDDNSFDVRGFVSGADYDNGWQQTSFNDFWEIYTSSDGSPSSTQNHPGSSDDPGGNRSTTANLKSFKGYFTDDIYTVKLEASLDNNEKAFAFGCDVMLAGNDEAPLTAVKDVNGNVQQIQLVDTYGLLEDASENAPAMVIRTPQTPSYYWLGHWSIREAYAYNTTPYDYGTYLQDENNIVYQLSDDDSGMTVSWTGLTEGATIPFEFSVGTVSQTGASLGATLEVTSDTITIMASDPAFVYKVVDKVGNAVTDWIPGTGRDIVISGLKQDTNYKIIVAEAGKTGPDDPKEEMDITTSINPGVTVDPNTGEGNSITCSAAGNALTFTGLNGNYFYFLKTADGNQLTYSKTPVEGALTFTDLLPGTDYYLAAISDNNQNYETVKYTTTPVVVTFDANGGVDAPASQTLSGENQFLTWKIPYRAGYIFRGWAKRADAVDPDHQSESIPYLAEDTTLYAVWKPIEKISVTGNVTFRYSYSYTTENGEIQSGVQNLAERASIAKVTLYKNGTPIEGDPTYVYTVMGDTTATEAYSFTELPKTDEYGRTISYTIWAVAVDEGGNVISDYAPEYRNNYKDVVMNYTPGCFDAAWTVTLTNVDEEYPVPDSIYVKVLYATEPSAELGDYQVITQQENNNGAQCFKVVQSGNTVTYSGSYPVWKYQANKLNQSYYHKFQVVGYTLNGSSFVDLSGENLIYDGEMFYNGTAASEVMQLSYAKTLIPTIEVAGDISMNYSYSYTTEGGKVQTGTQNVRERSTKVKVELLCNGEVADAQIVNLDVYGDAATGAYSYGHLEKYGPSGVNNYTIRVSALNAENDEVADYGVDISVFDATLTYSPECFDAAWTVTLQPGFEVVPSSVNVKVLYALTEGATLDGYEIISQQAENLGVECPAVVDGNGGVTYSGSYPVWKYQAGAGGSYYHKIQVVGYTIDGVYHDVSYRSDLISGGAMYFNGTEASNTMTLTIAPEIPAEEITVTGTVLDYDGVTGASGARVELRKGSEIIASTMADIYGHYTFVDVPDGDYNIVVTKGDKVMTRVVTVAGSNVSGADVMLPVVDVSSKIEIVEDNAVEHTMTDTDGTIVEGLDAIAAEQTPGVGEHVTIQLVVTPKGDVTSEGSHPDKEKQAAIKEKAAGKRLEHFDLKLTKTVTTGGISDTPVDIGDGNAKILKILIPFNTDRARNIVVYRYHGTEASAMKQDPAGGEEGYVVGKNCIAIYAKSFSPYAIGYTLPSSGSSIPSYSVSASDAENGKVSISAKNAYLNGTVTITVTPDEGYTLDELIVTDKNGNRIEVTAKGDGKYTFKMPAGQVTVDAKFIRENAYSSCSMDETCPIHGYPDASAAAWYHDGVHYCIENDLMIGVPGNLFAPEGISTRAQIVTVLWRLEGEPMVEIAEGFNDVFENEWYYNAIRWATENNIVEGYEGYFNPNDIVTREQMATILWRYAKHKGYDVSVGEETNILSYGDAFDIAEYAIPAMQWACGSGVLEGIGSGEMILNPQGSTTRDQMATMIMRFCAEIEK